MDAAVITAIAKFKAKPGQEARLKSELQALVAPTRKEQGCTLFDWYQSVDSEGVFCFFEKWTSRAALDKHLEAPHIKRFLGVLDGLVEGGIDASFWKQLA
jgi:quinol monooxygenase YgiN